MCFKEVSGVCPFKDVLRKFKECFKNVSKETQAGFEGIQEGFKVDLRKSYEKFKAVS